MGAVPIPRFLGNLRARSAAACSDTKGINRYSGPPAVGHHKGTAGQSAALLFSNGRIAWTQKRGIFGMLCARILSVGFGSAVWVQPSRYGEPLACSKPKGDPRLEPPSFALVWARTALRAASCLGILALGPGQNLGLRWTIQRAALRKHWSGLARVFDSPGRGQRPDTPVPSRITTTTWHVVAGPRYAGTCQGRSGSWRWLARPAHPTPGPRAACRAREYPGAWRKYLQSSLQSPLARLHALARDRVGPTALGARV